MAEEIERRFLVCDDFNPKDHTNSKVTITQSYMPNTGEWVIRVRKVDDRFEGESYFLTMKNVITKMTNKEHEVEITEEGYFDIMTSCVSTVEKTRYYITHDERLWEVDVFEDPSVEPKIIAEVEMFSETDDVKLPAWVATEVTGDKWYSNYQIAERIKMQE